MYMNPIHELWIKQQAEHAKITQAEFIARMVDLTKRALVYYPSLELKGISVTKVLLAKENELKNQIKQLKREAKK